MLYLPAWFNRRAYRESGTLKQLFMKKYLLPVLVLALVFQNARAQKSRVAAVGGVTISSMTGELFGNENGYQSKVGATLGLMLDAPIGASRFSFSPGLHYVQKGTLQRPPMGTLIDKSYISLRYVELNANFLYHAPGAKGNFFIGAGPSVAMKVPSKKGTMIGKDKTESDVNFGNTIDKDIRGVDYGANFLLGYRLKGGFMIFANYNRGLRDLRPVPESGPEDVYNQYFGIQLGWLFANSSN